jgi:hypothetical protein
MLLTGDIGGTKTDLALFSPEAGARAPLAQAEYRSANYPSLEAMVRAFLAQANQSVESACFDVAGPVINGRARLTNMSWTLDEATLQEELRLAEVHLLNDLQATAYAVPLLQSGDLHSLNAGAPMAGASMPLCTVARVRRPARRDTRHDEQTADEGHDVGSGVQVATGGCRPEDEPEQAGGQDCADIPEGLERPPCHACFVNGSILVEGRLQAEVVEPVGDPEDGADRHEYDQRCGCAEE